MEVKLKKVLDRVKKVGEATHEKKKSISPVKSRNNEGNDRQARKQISSFIALEGTEVIVDDDKDNSGLEESKQQFKR